MRKFKKSTLEKMLLNAEKRFEKADNDYLNKIKNIGWGTWNRKWKNALPSNNAVENARRRVLELELMLKNIENP